MPLQDAIDLHEIFTMKAIVLNYRCISHHSLTICLLQVRRAIGLFTLLMLAFGTVYAEDKLNKELSNPALVHSFYQKRAGMAFWFTNDKEALNLRRQLISLLDHCEEKGLDKYSYAYEPLKSYLLEDAFPADKKMLYDYLYTDVAISYLKDIQTGYGIEKMMRYDEFSSDAKSKDNLLLLELLGAVNNKQSLEQVVKSLEPATEEYLQLSKTLIQELPTSSTENCSRLKTALNCYRWLHHFQFEKYIVINIASATLRYMEKDSVVLEMKIVAGKPNTPTPRFAARCNEIILYPYWNVPHSIAVKEILPAVKASVGVLELLNMQVVDKKGKVVNPNTVQWSAYNARHLPYRFRQSTGCDNALGIIKFNLTSPYSVYLHDTNLKSAFAASKRYFSHGCIRLEQPEKLANYLLTEQLDSKFLAACLKNQRPVHLPLQQAVPVFVVYVTAAVDSGRAVFYDDIYRLR